MLAVVTGTRSRPAVELTFGFADVHAREGVLLREWVRTLPSRQWQERSRTWLITAFAKGQRPDRVLSDAGFAVVGPDGELTGIDDYDWPTGPAVDMPSEPTSLRLAAPEPLRYDGTIDGLRGVPVSDLQQVDSANAARLIEFGLPTVWDLLHHIPRRYIDLSDPQSVADVEAGQQAAVLGVITSVRNGPKMLLINVKDAAGSSVSCRYFNAGWMARKFAAGQRVIIHGKVEHWIRNDASTGYSMSNPLISALSSDAADSGQGMLPVYPQSAKEGIDTWRIYRAAGEAVERLGEMLDPLPSQLLRRRGLIGRGEALRQIHAPRDPAEAVQGRTRLAYDELFRLQLTLLSARAIEAEAAGIAHRPTGELTGALLRALPFEITGAQRRAVNEITDDLELAKPMHRMLQGDVGSGKTLTCLYGMLAAVEGGTQAVLMAPTEILASQHHAEVVERLDGVTRADGRPVAVALLTNKVTGPARKKVIAGLADGSIDIAVGTHALLAQTVVFARLGLAVIDEQHRFGVEQRSALKLKGPLRPDGTRQVPDILMATATPVPRTAVMTVFGDLDSSILDELPPGRTPTVTTIEAAGDSPTDDMMAAPWALIRSEVSAGRQAFVVCPMVGESMTKEAAAAETVAQELQSGALRNQTVGVVHGKQKPEERTEVMAAFARGDLDVLVATTVIEVGVNVPNATVLVVLGAERFGLAQLHQLRGRVGRGRHPGHCILVSAATTQDAHDRLDAMVETTDGFRLAEVDLRIRGAGTLLGAAQSGTAKDLRVASLLDDGEIIAWAREDALELIDGDPHLARRPHLRDEALRASGEDAARWLTSA